MASTTPKPRRNRKDKVDHVKATLDLVVERFERGDVAEAVAKVAFPVPSIPSAKWSTFNRTIVALSGSADARGFKQWGEVGRKVRKGARAVRILAPRFVSITDPRRTDEEGQPLKVQKLIGFRGVPVFRLEDTEGDPLPADQLQPAVPEHPLLDVAAALGIDVVATPGIGAWGYYTMDGSEIGLATPDEATFFHEITHAADHRLRGSLKNGQDPAQECAAQLGAEALCRLVGRTAPNEGYTFEYLKHYAHRWFPRVDAAEAMRKACTRVLQRACAAVELILQTAAQLNDGASAPEPAPAPEPPAPQPVKPRKVVKRSASPASPAPTAPKAKPRRFPRGKMAAPPLGTPETGWIGVSAKTFGAVLRALHKLGAVRQDKRDGVGIGVNTDGTVQITASGRFDTAACVSLDSVDGGPAHETRGWARTVRLSDVKRLVTKAKARDRVDVQAGPSDSLLLRYHGTTHTIQPIPCDGLGSTLLTTEHPLGRTIGRVDLADSALAWAQRAMGTDETRPNIMGLRLSRGEGVDSGVMATATDGHRCHVAALGSALLRGSEALALTIPSNVAICASALVKVLPGRSGAAVLMDRSGDSQDERYALRDRSWSLSWDWSGREYPEIERAWPKDTAWQTAMRVDAAALCAALRPAHEALRPGRGVTFTINGAIEIGWMVPDTMGEGKAIVQYDERTGDQRDGIVALQPKYALDAFGGLGAGATWRIVDDLHPVEVSSKDGGRMAIVMPTRLS